MGQVRWTVEQAAEAWGVTPKRIYKWIHGRSGSKGGGRRDAPGSRRRLFEGIDYAVESVFGRKKIIVILNDQYPAPILAKINRPTGIRREAPEPEVTPEAEEALASREEMLAAEEARQIAAAAVAQREAREATAEAQQEETEARPRGRPRKTTVPSPQPSVPVAPPPPPTFEQRASPEAPAPAQKKRRVMDAPRAPAAPKPYTRPFTPRAEPESISDPFDPLTVMTHAREAFSRAKGYFAAKNGISAKGLADAVFGAAIVNNPDDLSVQIVTDRMFDNVVTKGNDLAWRDTPALEDVRAAFRALIDKAIDEFQVQSGRAELDGLAAFAGLDLF